MIFCQSIDGYDYPRVISFLFLGLMSPLPPFKLRQSPTLSTFLDLKGDFFQYDKRLLVEDIILSKRLFGKSESWQVQGGAPHIF